MFLVLKPRPFTVFPMYSHTMVQQKESKCSKLYFLVSGEYFEMKKYQLSKKCSKENWIALLKKQLRNK